MEYLLQLQISMYIGEKYFCEYVHGRKEERRKAGDNPWELSKSDEHFCLNLRVSFCVVNYFPCISFILLISAIFFAVADFT